MTSEHRSVHLSDYTPPDWLVDTVALRFDIGEPEVTVEARLALRPNPAAGPGERELHLDGQGLRPLEVRLDGRVLTPAEYRADDTGLRLTTAARACVLETRVALRPRENTALEGLYISGTTLCTQCEAEGFRRITYYPDRPDVLARFAVTVVADRARYPVLLSNGNLAGQGELEDGRHWVRWDDPFPKPSYLFALIAGDLAETRERFVTQSGRDVELSLYVEHHNRARCAHALASLVASMRWDERTYGREYDLDRYMVVAVDDFNMGAMENKGLNVFNSKYVLADPQTATDNDFAAIEGVIGHEYFHNWTGNRVTCRDWFQLSLKEGLTVFRDQQFSAAMGSPAVKRIRDVRLLRTVQFAEDAGPMAHPVRPQSYIEISNFYTVTVYNKGAEVIRMLHTLLGAERFRAGMDLYFERHDGQAVTCDDFVRAMADASGEDLTQFMRWYDQAGTPRVGVRSNFDAPTGRLTLSLRQRGVPTPGQPQKLPYHIPLRLALFDASGAEMHPAPPPGTRRLEDGSLLVELREETREIAFRDIDHAPVVSINRGFSAPVHVDIERAAGETAFLMAHETDPFSRWDAAQELAMRIAMEFVHTPATAPLGPLPDEFVDAMAQTLRAPALDPALVAEALRLPGESYLAQQMPRMDVDAVHRAREHMRAELARALRELFEARFMAARENAPYRFEAAACARRSLKNLCLEYLMALDDEPARALAMAQFEEADNMTERLGALGCLVDSRSGLRGEALAAFERAWHTDALVMDKWFALQAGGKLPGTLEEVRRLLKHPAYDPRNPNRVRALVGSFCHANPLHFHAADGAGYRFAAERIAEIDPLNPQLAARLAGAFSRWQRLDEGRREAMRQTMLGLSADPSLSRDTYEVLSKTLSAGPGPA